MAENSKIEWTDHTQNFWLGCTKVSPACDNCYAENWAKRAGHPELWTGVRRRTKDWSKPKKWDKVAAETGYRPKVFTNSLADFFDNQADEQWRADAWDLIRATPHIDWLILTKRPQNIVKMLPADWGNGWANVWMGTTVENQEEAERRIHALLRTPAQVHFLSCEPLLGPLDLSIQQENTPTNSWFTVLEALDWVICGGEDYPRPGRVMDLRWARDLRDQCQAVEVPFFMKQIDKRQPIPADLMIREFPKAA